MQISEREKERTKKKRKKEGWCEGGDNI